MSPNYAFKPNASKNEKYFKQTRGNTGVERGQENISSMHDNKTNSNNIHFHQQYGLANNMNSTFNENYATFWSNGPNVVAKEDNNNHNDTVYKNNTCLSLMENQNNNIYDQETETSNFNPFSEYSNKFLSHLDNNNEFVESHEGIRGKTKSKESESHHMKDVFSEAYGKSPFLFDQDQDENIQDVQFVKSCTQQAAKDQSRNPSLWASAPEASKGYSLPSCSIKKHLGGGAAYSEFRDYKSSHMISNQYNPNIEEPLRNRRTISRGSENRNTQSHDGEVNYLPRNKENRSMRLNSRVANNNHDMYNSVRPQFHSREKVMSLGRIIESCKHNHPLTNAPGANIANINANITAHIDAQTGQLKTPGLPVKTSDLDKGPDGCNLFVFHIPNDMTNLTLYQLFSTFGNVLSARIMVDKVSGRSRGYGFVSFSEIKAAEEAIRCINGFVLGHKRLKVEQKKDKTVCKAGSFNNAPAGRNSFGQKPAVQKIKTNTTHVDSVTPQEAYILSALRNYYGNSIDKNAISPNSIAWINDETLLQRIRECCIPSPNFTSNSNRQFRDEKHFETFQEHNPNSNKNVQEEIETNAFDNNLNILTQMLSSSSVTPPTSYASGAKQGQNLSQDYIQQLTGNYFKTTNLKHTRGENLASVVQSPSSPGNNRNSVSPSDFPLDRKSRSHSF